MNYLQTAILLLFSCCCIAQTDERKSLIAVHVEPGTSGTQFRQQIVSYHFLNGSYVGRDEIMTVNGKVEGRDYIRTDLGPNRIYKNRYLITGMGNIIDMEQKKVLFDGRAQLVRCSNDSAVFYTNDGFKGKFYSVYNFKTAQYGEVKNLLFKAKPGQDVEFDKTVSPFRLYYYPADKPKILLTDNAGFGQPFLGEHPVDPPLFWLNDNEFIFAAVNKENTELSIYRLGINTGPQQLIGKIAMRTEKEPATFTQLEDEIFLLSIGSKQVLIDIQAHNLTDMEFSQPSYGFSYACSEGTAGRKIKLNGKEVGAFHFRPVTFKADKNIAGFVKEINMGDESYQQGLSVWNATLNAWKTVEAEEVLALVGWLDH